MPTAERTRSDIEWVKQRDEDWGGASQDVLRARMKAVIAAQRALHEHEAGAVYAFRGALVEFGCRGRGDGW